MLSQELTAQLVQLGIDPATVKSIIAGSIYLTIISVIAAIPTGLIAKRKSRSVAVWVVLALCVPVLPLVLVWLLPPGKPPAP